MNAPQLIMPETPIAEKPFRLKGCRYHLLYSGHLSKEIYYNWFRHNLMPRRDAQLALFIANINVNGAQFTKVIFKFNVTIDWKSIDKLDFPIGTGKSRPEVRPIYKSNWSTEYMNMVKQDPHTYPPLNDVNIISARSPKRVKGVSVVPPTPVPISVEPMAVSVSVSPLTIDQNSINPSVSGIVTNGMFFTLFTGGIEPLSSATPIFSYVVVGITMLFFVIGITMLFALLMALLWFC
jgi:hypothetical protein